MITIIDYGTGNLRSVQNMLRNLGVDSLITGKPDDIEAASKIILPGVGHFDFGMINLAKRKLVDVLNFKVLEQHTPTLGICLGAQLLTRGSDEGDQPGLGWIDADTVAFDSSKMDDALRVPHMGWADTSFKQGHQLFKGVEDLPRFYYVHSFHINCDNKNDELCHAVHGYRFVAGVARHNVMGVQFHPEKSHRFGKTILRNFARLN